MPGLSYHLMLRPIADADNCYTGTSEGSAASIMAVWRSSTPFSSGALAVVKFFLIFSQAHRAPNSPSNSPLLIAPHHLYFERRDVYLAARVQASGRYPNEAVMGENMWAEQASWACNALNYTATSASPKFKSPYKMWYGIPPQNPLSLLKSGYSNIKQRNNLKPKTVKCWYLRPAPNHPRDAMRTLYKSCRTIATRNVTWAHIATHLSSTSQQVVLAPNGVEDFQSGGDNGGAGKEPASRSETER